MPDMTPYPGTPRWVRVLGIAAVVLVILLGVLLLSSGGSHGPGRHAASGAVPGTTSPSSAAEPVGVRGDGPRAGVERP